MHFPFAPTPLYNPLTSAAELSPVAVYAGPFGLLAFLPLIPLVLLAARRWPRGALIAGGLVWLVATLRPTAAIALLLWLLLAITWVLGLAALRRRNRLSDRGMVALVWIGLHLLALPLWWDAQPWWYVHLSPLAALHQIGFAYYLLRLIAWGVSLARDPASPLRPAETAAWLLYPACLRLGPVLLRETFLERLAAWNPRRPEWRAGLHRGGLFLLGGAGIGAFAKLLHELAQHGDFLAHPEAFTTPALVLAVYAVPIHIYLVLWTYNELAAATSRWVGIRVDDNFNWLPAATSVRDFWRRWHITVGGWLRNYIYIPLGGSRRRPNLNLLAVFVYCGVWHGAAWSFVAWGLSQGLALVAQRQWDRWRERRGWTGAPSRVWTFTCWLVTLHYQIATIFMFADFHHAGWRVLRELLRRAVA